MPDPVTATLGVVSAVGANVQKNAASNAAEDQQKSIAQGQDYIRQATGQARDDVLNLFPAAQQNLNTGFQSALDVFNTALPQQAQASQAGNVAAQSQLLAGLPQMQNAILGMPIDNSALQPVQLDYNTTALNSSLPQFITSQQASGEVPEAPDGVMGPANYIGNALGGNTIDGTNWGQQPQAPEVGPIGGMAYRYRNVR